MLASLLFTVLASTSTVFTAPSAHRFQTSLCDVSKNTWTAPSTATSGSSPLATPIAGGPKFIGLGVGVQNYTCSSAGTYTSVGAYAELFDISCLPQSTFGAITDGAWSAWQHAPSSVTVASIVNHAAQLKSAPVLGQHYFIVNPITGSGLSPKWDFTSASEAGHADAFVVGAKTGDVPAPSDPTVNVDWLSLKNVQGDLASQVFRIETRGGQPPASCTPDSAELSVNYVSQYWFYGGSL